MVQSSHPSKVLMRLQYKLVAGKVIPSIVTSPSYRALTVTKRVMIMLHVLNYTATRSGGWIKHVLVKGLARRGELRGLIVGGHLCAQMQ